MIIGHNTINDIYRNYKQSNNALDIFIGWGNEFHLGSFSTLCMIYKESVTIRKDSILLLAQADALIV